MVKVKKRNIERTPVIEAYENGLSLPELVSSFPSISSSSIYRWIKQFKEDGSLEPKPQKWSDKKKKLLKVVVQMYSEGFRVAEIQRKVELVSKSTIIRWLREQHLKPSGRNSMSVGKSKIVLTGTLQKEQKEQLPSGTFDGMTPEELYTKYCKVQKELRMQKLRTKLAETTIDIAEKEFGIPIRKKSSAK